MFTLASLVSAAQSVQSVNATTVGPVAPVTIVDVGSGLAKIKATDAASGFLCWDFAQKLLKYRADRKSVAKYGNDDLARELAEQGHPEVSGVTVSKWIGAARKTPNMPTTEADALAFKALFHGNATRDAKKTAKGSMSVEDALAFLKGAVKTASNKGATPEQIASTVASVLGIATATK